MNVKRKSKITIILSAIAAIILLTASFLLGACSVNPGDANNTANTVNNNSGDNRDVVAITLAPSADDNSSQNDDSITYSNIKYGFEFVLPSSWLGYTIETEDWKGTAITGDKSGEVIETGEKLMIRHPDWTAEDPRQDIPIMVFTLDQWKKVENKEIALGGAPIGPSKLGSNSKYVFALPARYNFAFPIGFEEVEKIIEKGSLIANENIE